jgi:cytochrome c oxidase subunit 2
MAIQEMVLLVSLVLMAVIALIFMRAARAAGANGATPPSESARTRLIWVLALAGVVISVGSLARWPHAVSDNLQASATVNVTGAMWYWEIDKDRVPLGVPVVFNASTSDVTHGFGVMDPDERLLFQVQVMPGYSNQVQHVFLKPGVHRVVCLELCGTAHHAMLSEFTVAAMN